MNAGIEIWLEFMIYNIFFIKGRLFRVFCTFHGSREVCLVIQYLVIRFCKTPYLLESKKLRDALDRGEVEQVLVLVLETEIFLPKPGIFRNRNSVLVSFRHIFRHLGFGFGTWF